MADRMSKEARSKTMSKIRFKDTKPELILRKELFKQGYRYRTHYKIKGSPDIVFPSKKIAVFIDGCFWHKCPKCYKEPKSNKKYWLPKLKRNVERAKEVNQYLKGKGWKVLRFWEHEINNSVGKCAKKIMKELDRNK